MKPDVCRGCPLYEAKGPVFPPERSAVDQHLGLCKIALVGEAPGPDEAARGEAFVGRAGSVLDIGMKAAGMDRKLVHITNVVKCVPPIPGKPNSFRKPNRREVEFCTSRFLVPELAKLRPNVVVALGDTALSFLTGESLPITKWRGTILEVPDVPSRSEDGERVVQFPTGGA